MDKPRPQDRRQDRRIRASVYCRPAGAELDSRRRQPVDVSMGGIRIYSDDPLKLGELFKMEFFVPDTPPVTYTAEVVWIEPLDEGAPARFDVGLKFIQLEPAAMALLMRVLGPLEGEDAGEPASGVRGPGKIATASRHPNG
jgi:hypothetical protein